MKDVREQMAIKASFLRKVIRIFQSILVDNKMTMSVV